MRDHLRSHGIMLAMIGIVVAVMGILKATILPTRGLANWAPLLAGIACFVAGNVLAIVGARTRRTRRAGRDQPDPRIERNMPGARVLRNRRR
ncbi:MAG: hypothetical protein H0T89_07020 [Deltaproteobacteria bacterium]|nr:hypothetical protein [Deltaproteobacteria bacterium]MDQ3300044.1 hypothetical protein [Myxococcota bacterium]